MDNNTLIRAAQEREAVKQLAAQYVNFPEQIVAQGLGRQPELHDMKEFTQQAVSMLIGHWYDTLLQYDGKEKADLWIKTILTTAGTFVRMQGADVVLKFDVSSKQVPNTLHKRKASAPVKEQEVHQPQGDPGIVPPCECKLDGEGRCALCAPLMTEHFEKAFEPILKSREAAKAKPQTCRACNDSQIDFALSGFVPKLLALCEDGSEESRAMANELLNMLYTMVQQMGNIPIPRTEKVWAEGMAALALKATPAATPAPRA